MVIERFRITFTFRDQDFPVPVVYSSLLTREDIVSCYPLLLSISTEKNIFLIPSDTKCFRTSFVMLLELFCTAFVFSFANLTVNLNVYSLPFAVTGYLFITENYSLKILLPFWLAPFSRLLHNQLTRMNFKKKAFTAIRRRIKEHNYSTETSPSIAFSIWIYIKHELWME